MGCERIFFPMLLTACFSFVLRIAANADDSSSNGHTTPVFVSEPQNITTLQGQSIRFICRVQNLQSWQRLMWRHKNGNQDEVVVAVDNRLVVGGGERTVEQQQVEDGRASILGLQSATIDQEGNYVCVVSGTDQRQVNQLTVNVPATIVATEPQETNLNVLQGQPIYLSCTAEGKPKPVITWTKQGRQPFVGENLELAEASREDGGVYTCVADNGAGDPTSRQFNINLQYGPIVQVSTSTVRVGLHQRATLECIFDSNPPVGEVTWSREETSVDSGNNVIVSREDGQGGGRVVARLQIVSTTPGNVGRYSCIGDNSLGSASGHISVRGLPYDLQVTTNGRFSSFSDQHTVRWSVRSESVPDETQIILVYEDYDENETVSPDPPSQETQQFSVRMTSVDQSFPVYIQEFVFKELRPNSGYRFTLRVSNIFGFTNWTEEFQFETADEGNEAPLSTTSGTTQMKVNLSDENSRPRYTHHQTRNEPYGSDSLGSSSSLSSSVWLTTLLSAAIFSEVLGRILFQ